MRRCGYALFFAAWFVVLAVPQTRLLLRVQVRGSPFAKPRMQFLPAWLVGRDEVSPRDLAARFRNDPYVQALAAEATTKFPLGEESETAGNARQIASNLDAVIARFPNEPWLIARRLQWTTLFLDDDRVAGSEKGDTRPRTPPSPPEVAAALRLAEQGARLEPDNGYFDWYRVWLLLAAHHDREAMTALHQGAQKRNYNSHHREAFRVAWAVDRWRPLLIEERANLRTLPLFSEFGKARHVARLVVSAGAQAENAGDDARALTVYGDLMRMGAQMREGSYTIIEMYVAVAIESIAASGVGTTRELSEAQKAKLNQTPSSAEARTKLMVELLSDYATKHGRPDLSAAARRARTEGAKTQAASNKYINAQSVYGVPMNQYIIITVAMAVSGLLLPVMLVAGIVWCLVALMLRGTAAAEERVPWWIVALTMLLCFVAVGGAVGVIAAKDAMNPFGSDETSPLAGRVDALVSLAALSPLLLAALLCWFVTRRKFRGVFWTQVMPRADAKALEIARGLRRASGLVAFAAIVITIVLWLSHLIQPEAMPIITPVAASLALLGNWLIRWRWFMPDLLPGKVNVEEMTGGELRRDDRLSPRRAALWGLVWYRRSLGAFVVSASVVYLAIVLGSLPLRRQADAKFNVFIQKGELAVALGK